MWTKHQSFFSFLPENKKSHCPYNVFFLIVIIIIIINIIITIFIIIIIIILLLLLLFKNYVTLSFLSIVCKRIILFRVVSLSCYSTIRIYVLYDLRLYTRNQRTHISSPSRVLLYVAVR